MNADHQIRLDSTQNTGLVLDQWVESLAQVLESMTDQRPEVRWKAASGSAAEVGVSLDAGPESEILWWEQPFPIAPDIVAWVAAPRATWEYAGTVTLKAAGLETVERNEARNTWLEILAQSLSTMARSISSLLRREVRCEGGQELAPSINIREWASVQLSMPDVALAPLLVAFSPELAATLAAPPSPVELAPPEPAPAEAAQHQAAPYEPSRTMDLLMDVDLPLSISFGKAQLLLKDVVKLTTGSIVELNRAVTEPVELIVNNCVIARGEVVVVEGNYGVRIQQILSRKDRLRTLN